MGRGAGIVNRVSSGSSPRAPLLLSWLRAATNPALPEHPQMRPYKLKANASVDGLSGSSFLMAVPPELSSTPTVLVQGAFGEVAHLDEEQLSENYEPFDIGRAKERLTYTKRLPDGREVAVAAELFRSSTPGYYSVISSAEHDLFLLRNQAYKEAAEKGRDMTKLAAAPSPSEYRTQTLEPRMMDSEAKRRWPQLFGQDLVDSSD
jgi:hypothetical protein